MKISLQANDTVVTRTGEKHIVFAPLIGGKAYVPTCDGGFYDTSDIRIIARHNPVSEVKRHAKSGEWIKIVSKLNRSYPVPFVNGDIFQTDKMSEFIPGMAYITTTPWMFPDLEVTLVDSFEYVVMEIIAVKPQR